MAQTEVRRSDPEEKDSLYRTEAVQRRGERTWLLVLCPLVAAVPGAYLYFFGGGGAVEATGMALFFLGGVLGLLAAQVLGARSLSELMLRKGRQRWRVRIEMQPLGAVRMTMEGQPVPWVRLCEGVVAARLNLERNPILVVDTNQWPLALLVTQDDRTVLAVGNDALRLRDDSGAFQRAHEIEGER